MPATTNQNNTQGNTAGNSMEQLQMEAVIMQHNPERGGACVGGCKNRGLYDDSQCKD